MQQALLEIEPRRALTARTLQRLEDVASIRAAWHALEARHARPVFFQSVAWCLFLWRTRAEALTDPGIEHRVLIVEDGQAIVAIWPLAIKASRPGRFAQDLGEPFSQYSDILIDPDADASAVLSVAAAELSRWRIDGLVLRKVRADSPLRPWLERAGAVIGQPGHAPAIELFADGGHASYRATLNAKTRKNLRNYRNRLGREGRIVHDVIDAPTERAAVMARCFDGRTAWLAASGLSSTAFADRSFPAVVQGLTHGHRGAPPVLALRLGLEPPEQSGASVDLSLHWGFEHNGRYYAFMSWKNPAFDDFSPGRLHLEDVVAATAGRGMRVIDLLLPAIPYKVSIANTMVEVSAYGLPLTARGRLFIRGWHGLIRPALKAALIATPPGVRRLMMTISQRLKTLAARRDRRSTLKVSAADAPSPP